METRFLNEKNEMLKHVGYECKVVRPGSLEWETGVIIGVMSDKRSYTNMYRIECYKDKKVINKTVRNGLFELLESKSDRVIKSRCQNIDDLSKDDIIKKIELLKSELKVLESKLNELK